MIYFLSVIVRNATTRSEAVSMALGRYLLIVFWKCYSATYTMNWNEQMWWFFCVVGNVGSSSLKTVCIYVFAPVWSVKQWHLTVIVIVILISLMQVVMDCFLICLLATWSCLWASCSVVSPLRIRFPWCRCWSLDFSLVGGHNVEFIEPRCSLSGNSEPTCWQHSAALWAPMPGLMLMLPFCSTQYLWNSPEGEWVEGRNMVHHSLIHSFTHLFIALNRSVHYN